MVGPINQVDKIWNNSQMSTESSIVGSIWRWPEKPSEKGYVLGDIY